MPLYTYKCNDCDHEFEVRQRMVEDPLTICPVCGGAIRRVVSSVGVVFKGSGFYVTDNRSRSNGASSASSSKTTSKSTESSSDSGASSSTTTASESAGSTAKSSGDSAASG